MTHTEKALAYCNAALSDTLLHRTAGLLEKAACRRHLNDLARQDDPDWPYYFDEVAANRHCRFMELLPHVTGIWEGTNLVLEPHQCLMHTSLFGWKKKATGYRRFTKAYIELPRKNGKALSLDTLISTPLGWSTQGDLKVGDEVFDEVGNVCNVTNITEVMYNRPCYKLVFSNGQEVLADEEHEWLTTARVNMPGERKEKKIRRFREPRLAKARCGSKTKEYWYANLYGIQVYIGDCSKISESEAFVTMSELAKDDLIKYPFNIDNITRIRTTKEIFNSLIYGSRHDLNHSMAMPKPITCKEIELPISPYLFGSWLGDGNSNEFTISCGDQDVDNFKSEILKEGYCFIKRKDRTAWRLIVKPIVDGEIINDFNNVLSLNNILQQLNVFKNKHIPEIYLRSSFEQRLALLQGLMDTDGTVNVKGDVFQFVSISQKLATGFCELLSTMGIKFSLIEKPMRCNGIAVKDICYSVQFNTFKCEIPVFRLQRKLDRMREICDMKVAPRSKSVQIVSCEPVESVPVKCITVDSPSHLYLFGKTMLPTHNSLAAAGICLYLAFADGEKGAEVYCGATHLEQALAVFRPAWLMCSKSPDLRSAFDLTLAGTIKNPTSIYRISDMARCEPVVGKPGDGASVAGACVDEYHEHPDASLLGTMVTGTGSRPQALILIITTAGFNLAYPCREENLEAVKILEGTLEKENVFTMIFTIDPTDAWDNWESWAKANPNYGVSILPDVLKETYATAMSSVKDRATLLTKHLNLWSQGAQSWVDMLMWEACKDTTLKLEDFYGQEAFVGMDLASKLDLCAVMLLFRMPDGKIAIFGKYYLPSDTVERPENKHWQLWRDEGILTVTEGARTDYHQIEQDLIEADGLFKIRELAFDQKEASYLVTNLQDKCSFECIEINQSPSMISEPMKELEALIASGSIRHNGDKLLAWSMSNVVKKSSRSGTETKHYYPTKQNNALKIDPAVAIIMAISRLMVYADTGDSYNSRAKAGIEEILRVI